MQRSIRLLILGLAIALVAAEPRDRVLVGKVVAVADGDTLTVLDSSQQRYVVRLDGIDAPEDGQEYSDESKQALVKLTLEKQVRVVWREKDRYARTLGTVLVSPSKPGAKQTVVNLELVSGGAAWHYKEYSTSKDLAKAEIAAREAKVGLWANGTPLPPWEHRKQQERQRLAAGTGAGATATVAAEADRDSKSTTPAAAAAIPNKVETQSVTVYVTKTGTKYHLGSCHHLKKSKIPKSLEEARQSYSPCSVCNPPM